MRSCNVILGILAVGIYSNRNLKYHRYCTRDSQYAKLYVCYLERRHYTRYQCIINVLSTSVYMHRHHEIAPLN